MEIGTEISHKIRSAIKTKLVDLGAYVDDELPDYIMVMIANKKTHDQMADDLSLFLGNNTEKFTTWLHAVLQKLQSATLESSSLAQTVTPSSVRTDPKHATTRGVQVQTTPQSTPPPPPPPPSLPPPQQQRLIPDITEPDDVLESEEAIISLKPESNEFIDEELKRDSVSNEAVVSMATVGKHTVQKVSVPPTAAKGQSSVMTRTLTSGRKITVSKVQPVTRKRKSPGSVIGQVITHDNDDDDEEDYKMSKMGGVASVVRISERRTTLPRSKQASRALVLKAVNEAADSVSRVPGRQRPPAKSPALPTRQQSNKTLLIKAMSDARDSLSRQPRTGKIVQIVRRVEPLTKPSTVSMVTSPVSQPMVSEDDTTIEDIEETEIDVPEVEAEENVKYYVLEPEEPSPVVRRMVAREIEASPIPVVSRRVSDEVPTSMHRTATVDPDAPPVVFCRRFSDDITSVGGGLVTNVDTLTPRVAPRVAQIVTKDMHMAPRITRTVSDEMDTTTRRMLVVSNEMDAPRRMRTSSQEMDMAPRRDVAPRRTQIVSRDRESQRRMLVVSDAVGMRKLVTDRFQHIPSVTPKVEVQMPYQHSDQRVFQTEDDVTTEEMSVFDKPQVIRQLSAPSQWTNHRTIVDQPRPVSPKFIVTLDGVDPPTSSSSNPRSMAGKKRQHSTMRVTARQQVSVAMDDEGVGDELEDDDVEEEDVEDGDDEEEDGDEEMDREEEEDFMDTYVMRQRAPLQPFVVHKTVKTDDENTVTETTPPKKAKMIERCKFWPTCKNGDRCPYHHPNVPCKAFPKCRYGDKCLYIHPNCKYDARCGKIECPFTHASRRQGSGPAPPPPPPPSPVKPFGGHFAAMSQPVLTPHQVVCKFYPNNCKKMDCPYLHPKPCRYGTSCSRSDCRYSHPKIPSGAALKWVRPDILSKST